VNGIDWSFIDITCPSAPGPISAKREQALADESGFELGEKTAAEDTARDHREPSLVRRLPPFD
jgi:hypothetical protein